MPVEVYVAGLLLTDEHVRHLCLTKYGYTEEDLEKLRPTDLATLYYSKQQILDGADLIDVDTLRRMELFSAHTYLLPGLLPLQTAA